MLDPISDFSGREGTVSVQVTANATHQEVLRVGKNATDLNASFRSMRLGIPDSFIGNDQAYVGLQMITRKKFSVGCRCSIRR